jgi:hypothetical protein
MDPLHLVQFFMILIAGFQQSIPAITAPIEGQTLQGVVEITGSLDAANFSGAELSFAYASDPSGTWFLIRTLPAPAEGQVLAAWDTSQLTDGDYRLRLRQVYTDGSFQEVFVENLHVRNDAPTVTPTSPLPTSTPTHTPSPSATVEQPAAAVTAPPSPTAALSRPTPRPLPSNPASISAQAIYSVFGRAALLVLILFLVLGIFLGLRRR